MLPKSMSRDFPQLPDRAPAATPMAFSGAHPFEWISSVPCLGFTFDPMTTRPPMHGLR